MIELIDDMKIVFEYFNGGDYVFFVVFLLAIIMILFYEEKQKY